MRQAQNLKKVSIATKTRNKKFVEAPAIVLPST
jgi:hypothetical protein